MEDFKGNPENQNNPKPSTTKAVTTNVIVKKDSEARRLGKRFISEDAKTVGSHVAESVIIPSLQKLVCDAVKSMIDWIIYGSKGSRQPTGVGTISYGSYYNRSGTVNPNPTGLYANPMVGANKPTLYAVNDIIIADRGEAEEVLLRMKEMITSYGMVSVGDFYDLVGQRANFTDQKWGWFDLRTADIIRVDNGFCIRFPRVQPIEK